MGSDIWAVVNLLFVSRKQFIKTNKNYTVPSVPQNF